MNTIKAEKSLLHQSKWQDINTWELKGEDRLSVK